MKKKHISTPLFGKWLIRFIQKDKPKKVKLYPVYDKTGYCYMVGYKYKKGD